MFGISGFELLIVAAFVLIIFGPDKLPELARTAGKTIKMFKRAQEDMEAVIRGEIYSADAAAAVEPIAEQAPIVEPKASAAESIWADDDEDEEEEEE